MKEEILILMKQCVKDINLRIAKSNDTLDKSSNKFFAPLVYLVQNECDKILSKQDKSHLECILLCAQIVNIYEAGNCMLQSFLALDQLIKGLFEKKLINEQMTCPIAICTIEDHTFLMIDELVCDPWANYYGSWNDYPSVKDKVDYYFFINQDWTCYNDDGYDALSTQYTYELVNKLHNSENLMPRTKY